MTSIFDIIFTIDLCTKIFAYIFRGEPGPQDLSILLAFFASGIEPRVHFLCSFQSIKDIFVQLEQIISTNAKYLAEELYYMST